jgi:FKBP-type peptidyl-prolyl cis-trans isomerase
MSVEMNSVSYSVGISVAMSLKQQNLETLHPEAIAEAINDVFKGNDLKISMEDAQTIIQDFLQKQSEEQFSKNKEAGEIFLANNKEKAGIFVTESGLQYEIIKEGNGKSPSNSDTVEVHYHGTLIDGTVFDSSIQRGTPAKFGVNQVIKGWTEALQLMNEGATYRLYIPENLAYGSQPHPGGPIEPFMALVFDVELIAVHN